jgi:PAB1-binding protein PBP1
MIGYKLTENQKNFVQNKYYSQHQFINCVQDINGIWFTFFTDEDKAIISTMDIAWILECEHIEYIPPIPINPFDN